MNNDMGFKRIACKIATGILLAPAIYGPALAESRPPLEPLNLKAKYSIAWNGISLGRIYLTAQEDSSHYTMSVDTKTHGIARMFSKEKRIATAEGTVGAKHHYVPVSFKSGPQDEEDQEESRATLTYDAHGLLKERVIIPPDDPNWRPLVPLADTKDSTDPVTAGLILRRKLYAALSEDTNHVSVGTYDGKRLAEMQFGVIKLPTRVSVMDQYRQVITTVVTRTPISGYTPKEIKAYNKGDPRIRLYFSDDAQFIPLRATVDTAVGVLSATLEKIE